MKKGWKLFAGLSALMPLVASAWDYANQPLIWDDGAETLPNAVLMIDDSHSMHYQVVSESWQRVLWGDTVFAVSDWYVCTGYNPVSMKCTSTHADSLAAMAGASTLDPAQTGITVLQQPFTDNVPDYVYEGNGVENPVPGAALCDVSKNPGEAGFYLGQSGDSVPGLSSQVGVEDIGVLVSRSTGGVGTNDSCVRWKPASTGSIGGIDEYTAYPGDYANFLLSKHAGALPGSLDFSDTATYADVDPDPTTYVPAIDDKIIPHLTRIEAAREIAQRLIVSFGDHARFGLYSLDSEQERPCSVGTDTALDKAALVGPLYGNEPADLPASAADGLVGTLRAATVSSPLANTQAAINSYFQGEDSPLRYRCQRSHIIVISDGEAQGDTSSLDVVAQSGYDTDAKTVGNDADGESWNDASNGGRWQYQRVVTHTVNVGVDNELLRRAPLVDQISVGKNYISNNAVDIVDHRLETLDTLQVVSGAASGLTNGNYYYVVKVSSDRVRLATTRQGAASCAAGNMASCVNVTASSGTMIISTGPGGAFNVQQGMDDLVASFVWYLDRIFHYQASMSTPAINGETLDSGSRVFRGIFNTSDWSGEVSSYDIDTNYDGGIYIDGYTPQWTTKTSLNVPAEHGVLLTWNGSYGVPFDWPNLNPAQQAALVNPDTVSWIKGYPVAGRRDQSANGLLGDIGNGNLLHVGALNLQYERLPATAGTGADSYAAYVAASQSRTPMLLAGANDGMLHVFNSQTGSELLGVIPEGVYQAWHDANKNQIKDVGETENKLYNRTLPDYLRSGKHRYFVDGKITAGDAFIAGVWKTLAVGGLGAGGRSIYAIDLTDSSFNASDLKWEFSNANLGFTFGKPVIARFADNQWYAVFANGPDAQHDQASVFVVNLANPADYHELRTYTGSAVSQNGAMTVQVRYNAQRTASAIYAGDLQGNVWVFDGLDDTEGLVNWPAVGRKLFTARDPGNLQQSITGGITLLEHPYGDGTLVYFGTGKYFEKTDAYYGLGDVPQVDSFYAVLDDGSSSNLVRADLLQQMFFAPNLDTRTSSGGYYGGEKGWFIDLLDGATKRGERFVDAPYIQDDRVVFVTKTHGIANHCVFSGGTAYLNVLHVLDGAQYEDAVVDADGDGELRFYEGGIASLLLDGPISLIGGFVGTSTNSSVVYSSGYRNDGFLDFLVVKPALNFDGDAWGDTLDPDDDNDGWVDYWDDVFPYDPTEWLDTDDDGTGNNADTDDDNDGVLDAADAFPLNDVEWLDTDGDGSGNNADQDDDGDGVPDWYDPFPLDASEWWDSDWDGIGDNSDPTPNGDYDNDGVDNSVDNCLYDWNEDQLNTDDDWEGDVCDATPNGDDDYDGIDNLIDNCPYDENNDQLDTDGDLEGDICDATPNGDDDGDGVDNLIDNCVSDWNDDQLDTDGDWEGDVCDLTPNGDYDGDGVDDLIDNCFYDWNDDQLDTDGDSEGDICDVTPNGDDDGDGVDNLFDNCVSDWNEDQLDSDGDLEGDVCDATPNGDDDGDGVDNLIDNCVFDWNDDQLDTDGDMEGNVCDWDDDNDGIEDSEDPDPLVPGVGEPLLQLDGIYRGSSMRGSTGLQ